MQTILQILGGVAGLVLLYYGAEFLVMGGVRVANALKIPSIVIGLTLVAFATSAPELVVSIDSAIKGSGDISLGNVIGSNICNIGLILGLATLITPMNVKSRLLKIDTPVLFGASALLTFYLVLTRGVSRGQSAIFLICFIAYMAFTITDALRHPVVYSDFSPETPDASAKKPMSIFLAILLVIIGIFALALGARFFVGSSVYFARLFHVSDALIGLTVVALGTSLPELATSTVAAIKGEKDIAVGNVVGSNIFNVLSILGIAPLIRPLKAVDIQSADLLTMCVLTVLMTIMMYTGKVLQRIEGAILLAVYIAYITYLCVNL